MTGRWGEGEKTHVAVDGTVRQDHYGSGRQPWDDIRDAGWGPEFAAANVLKYLRRTKEVEHSLKSAVWYWERLYELVEQELSEGSRGKAFSVRYQLVHDLLTQAELDQLRKDDNAPSP